MQGQGQGQARFWLLTKLCRIYFFTLYPVSVPPRTGQNKGQGTVVRCSLRFIISIIDFNNRKSDIFCNKGYEALQDPAAIYVDDRRVQVSVRIIEDDARLRRTSPLGIITLVEYLIDETLVSNFIWFFFYILFFLLVCRLRSWRYSKK
uniref:Uncharacterized protein n=1 Tax=Morchella brunnea TaxID=1174671 RepID=A0A8K1I7L6_9PEZI|nr:hypothetical protein LK370_mgp245 [Morchella brunnea]UBU98346.1 hypothetical protein [Morchella brunnea]